MHYTLPDTGGTRYTVGMTTRRLKAAEERAALVVAMRVSSRYADSAAGFQSQNPDDYASLPGIIGPARDAIRALLDAGYTITPPSKP